MAECTAKLAGSAYKQQIKKRAAKQQKRETRVPHAQSLRIRPIMEKCLLRLRPWK